MNRAERVRLAYLRMLDRAERDANGCLLFTGGRSGVGYGMVRVGFGRQSTVEGVHRVAYEARHGKIPRGLCVLHTCDVRHCIEDAHHFLGTKADNSADMVAKGRSPHMIGERSGTAKLTARQVRRIRRRYATGRVTMVALATEYGVGHPTISKIIRRRLWASID